MSLSILLVDNEKVIRDGLSRFLSNKYDVLQAVDGRDAIEELEKNIHIKIVLADFKMPVMDGLELLKKIPSIREDLIVILFTAIPTTDLEDDAMFYGAADFLTKPLDLNRLEASIKNAIDNNKVVSEGILNPHLTSS
jgi:two-component system NtrC family response regulator